MDKASLIEVVNRKLNVVENVFVSDSLDVFKAGLVNISVEVGRKYMPVYLQYPDDYDVYEAVFDVSREKSMQLVPKYVSSVSDLIKVGVDDEG